ncbi:MAG: hypothetical protein ACE5JB_01340 [bacterium]
MKISRRFWRFQIPAKITNTIIIKWRRLISTNEKGEINPSGVSNCNKKLN